MRNYFTFNGFDSREFGVYISGGGTFDSPTRLYNVISVQGRSGDLIGAGTRLENIEVTYPAFIYTNFAENLANLRSALLSTDGYARLEDTYHPSEYRMAYFDGPIVADVTPHNNMGSFDLKFKCKPQRWLKSGETPVTIGEWGETTEHSGSIATFEAVDSDAVKSLTVAIEPVQSGSGDPSPTNVRPISGHDSVEVTRTGKNLANSAEWVRKTYSSDAESTIRGRLFVGAFPVGTRISISVDADFLATYRYAVHNMIKPYPLSSSSQMIDSGWKTTSTYQLDTVNKYIGLCVSRKDNGEIDLDDLKAQTIMLNIGTPVDYVPFTGFDTYTTSLGQTVYGGTLDVVSGVLTVDRAMVDLGTLNYTYDASVPRFYSTGIKTSVKPPQDNDHEVNAISSAYKVTAFNRLYTADKFDGTFAVSNTGTLNFINRTYTTAADFKSAMSGVQLVYELATPQTIQLTPQQVALLVGTNNVWSDSGNVTVEVGTNPNMLVNPTRFASSPIIRVTGYGTLNVGSDVITIANAFPYVDIDSEIMDCYHGTDNANSQVTFSSTDFPKLASGSTGITYSGNITQVAITPRWFEV